MVTANNIIRDQFTESQENPNLYKPQFYTDAGGLNIGYGFNLTKNPSIAISYLEAANFNQNFSPAQWDAITTEINTLISIPAAQLTQANVNSLNALLGTTTITQTQAQTLMDNYYASAVDNVLPSELENYANLTPAQVTSLQANPDAWASLQDLVYNAPGVFTASKVPGLNAVLSTAVTTGNWGQAAYDIGFNPNTDVPVRREDESLLMLGFNSTNFDGTNPSVLTPISSTSVNNPSLISYEQNVATGDLEPYSTTQGVLVPYLAQQGYYVPQSSADTWSIIAAQDGAATGVNITGAQHDLSKLEE